MTIRKLFLLAIGVCSFGLLKAQDLHFTMYDMAPLSLNPAFTGAYEGTARVGGIYRDQWASFIDNQFVTPSFYVDAPIIRGFREQDWVGVGGMLITDKAGTSELQTGASMLSASYHFALDKKGENMLTLGVQGGNVSRRIDLQSTDLIFADEIEEDFGGGGLGTLNSPDRNINDEKSYLDFNVGLMLRSRIDDESSFEAGVAFNHITQPEYAFRGSSTQGGSDSEKRPMTLAFHGRYNRQLTDQFSITPSFLVQNTKGNSEILLQALGGYQLNEQVQLLAGPGLRFGDAASLIVGVQYDDLRVQASYDFNTSSLNEVSNYQGGFELAAQYIIKIYKKPEVNPTILCPRL